MSDSSKESDGGAVTSGDADADGMRSLGLILVVVDLATSTSGVSSMA